MVDECYHCHETISNLTSNTTQFVLILTSKRTCKHTKARSVQHFLINRNDDIDKKSTSFPVLFSGRNVPDLKVSGSTYCASAICSINHSTIGCRFLLCAHSNADSPPWRPGFFFEFNNCTLTLLSVIFANTFSANQIFPFCTSTMKTVFPECEL